MEPGEEVAGQRGEEPGGLGAEKVEHGRESGESGNSDGIRRRQSHVEALNRGSRNSDPLPRGNRSGFLEQGWCPSPVAVILAAEMDLGLVELVEWRDGCAHLLYSDRGPVRCTLSLVGRGGVRGAGCCVCGCRLGWMTWRMSLVGQWLRVRR